MATWIQALPPAEQAQLFYFAYYGRPADVTGQQFWTQGVQQYGSLQAVSAVFGASAESQAIFGGLSTLDAVAKIYEQMFNRVPEKSGLDYWVKAINDGVIKLTDLPLMIAQGAQGADLEILQNKLAAASAFTAAMMDQVNDGEEQLAYQGIGATYFASQWLATVGDDASLAAALTQIEDVLVQIERFKPGKTFTLTTGADQAPAFTGTSGSDLYEATSTTMTAFDHLDGELGYDRLHIVSASGGLPSVPGGVTVEDIENILIESNGSVGSYATPFEMHEWAGVEQVNITALGDGGYYMAVSEQANDGNVNITSAASEVVNIDAAGYVFVEDMSSPEFNILAGEDVTVYGGDVTSISVTNTGDWYDDLTIVTTDTETLELTVTDVHSNTIIEGPANLLLTANGESDDLWFTNYTDDSTLETITVVGGEAAYLGVDATQLRDTLNTFDSTAFAGDVWFDGAVTSDNTDLTVLTAGGDDYIEVSDVGTPDNTTVTVDAGEGDNYISLNVHGVIDVTAGEGDDELETNIVALRTEGSNADLNGGDNTLSVHFEKTVSDSDIDSFGGEPVQGTIGTVNIWDDVVLSGESTLDVSAFDGEVHTLGFDNVVPYYTSEDGYATPTLNITGVAPELDIYSYANFGRASDGHINLVLDGVEKLTIDANYEIGINLNGAAAVAVTAAAEQTQMVELTDITLLAEDQVALDIANFRNGATIYANGDSNGGGYGNVNLYITESTLGNVTAVGGEDNGWVDINVSDTVDSEVTVGDIVGTAYVVDGSSNNDGNVYVDVTDNSDSDVTIGNVTLTASSDAGLWVAYNDGATVTVGNVDVYGENGEVWADVNYNDGATVEVGSVNVEGWFGGVNISDNGASHIDIADVTVDTTGYYYANFSVEDNWDSMIHVGPVSVTNESGSAFAVLVDNDNYDDDQEITVGSIDVSGYYYGAFAAVDNDDTTAEGDLEITVGDVTVDGYYYGAVEISDNDEMSLDVGNVDVSAYYYAAMEVSDNDDSAVDVGNVTMDGYYTSFWIDGNDDGSVTVGDVTITAGEDAYVWVDDGQDNIELGDVSVSAGYYMNVVISDVDMGDLTLDLTAETGSQYGYVWISDANGLETLTVSAASDDASYDVILDYVDDLAKIDLTGMVDGSQIDLDLYDASLDQDIEIELGAADVNYRNDTSGNAETFVFDGTGVGDVVIGQSGVSEFDVTVDGIDLAALGVTNLDVTIGYSGSDIVIDFDDADLGSITLAGLNAGTTIDLEAVLARIHFA